MRKPVILVTGAGGEIGHGLIVRLAERGASILTLDVNPLDPELARLVTREITGSILDTSLPERILAEYEIEQIFHLAALLSTRSEFTPVTAHHVNVEGTLAMLEFAQREGESHDRPVIFLYPSSIAAYGLPDAGAKPCAGKVKEDEWNFPTTMYGCNKLYCEQLGRYYARHYKQLAGGRTPRYIDFRAIRFPGLISAVTIPSGGTSDYAPEMIHAAARGEPYVCFVRPDTRIPFLAMPDATDALVQLAAADQRRLRRSVYNAAAFNPSAEEIAALVRRSFADARTSFRVDPARQAILDSWPADVDDRAAREDWGFAPKYDLERTFSEYVIPVVNQRYRRT